MGGVIWEAMLSGTERRSLWFTGWESGEWEGEVEGSVGARRITTSSIILAGLAWLGVAQVVEAAGADGRSWRRSRGLEVGDRLREERKGGATV